MAVTSNLAGPSFQDAPAWERIVTQTWATGDAHAEQSETVAINGILQKLVLKKLLLLIFQLKPEYRQQELL